MSYATKKPFPEPFTFEGVKGSILQVADRRQSLFLSKKQRTFHPGGERLGERFIDVSIIYIKRYITFPYITLHVTHIWGARTRGKRKVAFQSQHLSATLPVNHNHFLQGVSQ